MNSPELEIFRDKKSFTEDNIPKDCFCPITQEIMQDPVSTSDGHTYERKAIETWFSLAHRNSPYTGKLLLNTVLTPNHGMRNLIQELKEQIPQLAMQKLLDEQSIVVAISLREADLFSIQNEKMQIRNSVNEIEEKYESSFQEILKELKACREESKSNGERISALEKLNTEKDSKIAKLYEDIQGLKNTVSGKDNEIDALKEQIKNLRNEVEQKNITISNLEEKLKNELTSDEKNKGSDDVLEKLVKEKYENPQNHKSRESLLKFCLLSGAGIALMAIIVVIDYYKNDGLFLNEMYKFFSSGNKINLNSENITSYSSILPQVIYPNVI